MNIFINFLIVISVVSVIECYPCSESLEHGSSRVCDSANEVTQVLNEIDDESPEDKDDLAVGRRKYNVPGDRNGEEYGISAETVKDTASIENTTGEYQHISSSEENEDESKSTLIDFPFSVSIQRKGSHYVSGALVSNVWVLSVAGEFFHVRDSLKLFRARLGSVDCKKGGTLVPVKKIEIHPYYIYGRPNFDVSLVRLAKPVEFSDVLKPIPISSVHGEIISAKFMTSYWPRIVINGNPLPQNAKERTNYNSLRVSTQKLIPSRMCRSVMASIKEHIHESSLCLNPVVTHHSVCMPDAGAPVVAEDGIWGITSGWISPTCPFFAGPTIFTRLSSSPVRSWLGTQLQNA